jgi:UDP-N-acetylglucosamine 4,6-dehydratase/5-epimerase
MATVLITGGTGFLGRRMAVALRDRFDVVLGARNSAQNARAATETGCPAHPLDVARIESVRDLVIETRPEVIIHAAATKFVDLAERLPMECVDVNVVGSQNVARVAIERDVRTVVGISTDKASPPIRNTYGLSKALMERMFCSLDRREATRFTCVRYGNVAWSTGSVLPVWKEMHDRTGVIGSTGPHMRRFFFSVDEAVALIGTAVDNIDVAGGHVLARHMKAALIRNLLEVWTARFGGRWEQIAGRPGERDTEYLIGELELPHTERFAVDAVTHYLISFNQKTDSPVSEVLSSANTTPLTEAEMLALIEAGQQ